MKRKNENGMVIVEAAIVFPVMFLVIFFMIYTGNSFSQRCKIESIIERAALHGASACADPMLEKAANQAIPSGADGWEVYPYRYFSSTGVGEVDKRVREKIEKDVKSVGTGLFAGMEAKDFYVQSKYKNGFLYATLSVDVNYRIEIPIRMLGEKDPISLKVGTHVEMPVSDSAELIRNIDMVEDYVERTGLPEKISELVDHAKQWFDKP